ncbi:MAG: glycosyltransferase [Actinomycetota bacterium]
MPNWPIDEDVSVLPLQTLPADGGHHLYRGPFAQLSGRIPRLSYSFTENSLRALDQLNRQLTAEDSIIFTHPLLAQVFRTAIGESKRSAQTVIQIHGDYKARHPELTPILLDAAPIIDHVQVVSEGMRTDYDHLFGADRVTWIPNIHEPIEIVRKGHKGVNVVVVGSFQEAKNQIDAVRMLRGVDDGSVRLTFWGNASTKYAEQVRRVIDQLGLNDRVVFAGTGDEQQIYGDADIVLIPSTSEGFGYPLVEAASHRLPVVCYDYDYGPRDVIRDGASGYIVPVGDVRGLSDRVADLARDPGLRESMGTAASLRFEDRFHPERIADDYQALLTSRRHPAAPIESMFPLDGTDPVPDDSIRAHTLEVRGRRIGHVIRFQSRQPLDRFAIHSNAGSRRTRALRVGRHYVTLLWRGEGKRFWRARRRSISYERADRRDGRFYLAHTSTRAHFEVARFLRRNDGHDWLRGAGPQGLGNRQSSFEVHNGRMMVRRNPRLPDVSGRDDDGAVLNTPGGVELAVGGDVRAPYSVVRGDFDWVQLSNAGGTRRIVTPYGYGELFERVCSVERSAELFARQTADGIHPWELCRAPFIIAMCEALGLWGPQHSQQPLPSWDVYVGDPPMLTAATGFDRVLFEFPRKPDGVDARTEMLQDEDTMVIEYPQYYGYARSAYEKRNHYPINEYNRWVREHRNDFRGDFDTTDLEHHLSAALGFPVVIDRSVAGRIVKYRLEYEFWSGVFDALRPSEVIVPSSHWSAGICQAAKDAGALSSDVQYALTSRYHPSFWFGDRPRHGASKLYAWSEFWATRTNGYDMVEVASRQIERPHSNDVTPSRSDYLVITQPRLFRRMSRFVRELALRYPDRSIAIAPHPDEVEVMSGFLRQSGLANVRLATVPTLEAVCDASVCIGAFSTSVYEAAALGKPVYILPIPGHEVVLDDVANGLFRLVEDLGQLEPFEPAEYAQTLFA